jgi:hypothetical protein
LVYAVDRSLSQEDRTVGQFQDSRRHRAVALNNSDQVRQGCLGVIDDAEGFRQCVRQCGQIGIADGGNSNSVRLLLGRRATRGGDISLSGDQVESSGVLTGRVGESGL